MHSDELIKIDYNMKNKMKIQIKTKIVIANIEINILIYNLNLVYTAYRVYMGKHLGGIPNFILRLNELKQFVFFISSGICRHILDARYKTVSEP